MHIYTQVNLDLSYASLYIDLHIHKADFLSQNKLSSITKTQPYHEHL